MAYNYISCWNDITDLLYSTIWHHVGPTLYAFLTILSNQFQAEGPVTGPYTGLIPQLIKMQIPT